jgi:hyaluronoglucosaminidase
MQANISIKTGVIEGFFGKPWDWEARMSAANFLRTCGYQFYVYAPKAEAFLRRRWRESIPATTLQCLSKLSERCRQQAVSFGIGLTPFEIYLNYDAGAQSSLRSKVLQINEIAADTLCILFDDMRGDVAGLAQLQAGIIADICAWSNAAHFIVCPTYYSYDSRLSREFGPPPKAYLRDLGRSVDSRIDFFWTGEQVISDGHSAEHLAEVAADIGRKPFIWDNHISNDSRLRASHLYLDPSTGSWDLPPNYVAGLAINPMNQPHLSRIALCEYRQLLAQGRAAQRQQFLRGACRNLCGSLIAERLLADIDLLQNSGIAGLDAATRRTLLDWYARESSPCAQEIAAWLRGEYAFDPQCLTT